MSEIKEETHFILNWDLNAWPDERKSKIPIVMSEAEDHSQGIQFRYGLKPESHIILFVSFFPANAGLKIKKVMVSTVGGGLYEQLMTPKEAGAQSAINIFSATVPNIGLTDRTHLLTTYCFRIGE